MGQSPVEMLVSENPMWRVYLEDSIPSVPQEVLVRETSRWIGSLIPHRVWPGEGLARHDYFIPSST